VKERGMSATYEDRYGLPLSTQGQDAAEHYMEGIDRALALTVGAPASLEAAIAADADFAMAHIALAREFQIKNLPVGIQAQANASLHATADIGMVIPTYVFATPVLGGARTQSVASVRKALSVW